MKKTRFTEGQILKVLKKYQAGKKVVDISREYGISDVTFYNWKSKYLTMAQVDLKNFELILI